MSPGRLYLSSFFERVKELNLVPSQRLVLCALFRYLGEMSKTIRLEKTFLSEVDLEDLGLRSRKTSQNLRAAGRDPLPFTRIGRSVRYPAAVVFEYLEQRAEEPESE